MTTRMLSEFCLELHTKATFTILVPYLDGRIDYDELATLAVNAAATLIRFGYGQGEISPAWAEMFTEQFKEQLLDRLLSLPPPPDMVHSRN